MQKNAEVVWIVHKINHKEALPQKEHKFFWAMIPTKISTIVLDTADLETVDINNIRSTFTFRNIDFDQLLGEDWRAHDLFNVVLVSTVFDKMNSTSVETLRNVVEVRLSGLPFVDSDVRVNRNTSEVALCTIDTGSNHTAANITNYPGGVMWTISRDDENLMNFRLRLVNPNNDTTVTYSGGDSDVTYPRQQYVFKVYHL